MKGSHQLQWSRGLKALVGIDDRGDEDLATNWLDDDQAAYLFASLSLADWAAVYYCGPEAKADIEGACDRHDRGGLAELLAGYQARYFAEGWGL